MRMTLLSIDVSLQAFEAQQFCRACFFGCFQKEACPPRQIGGSAPSLSMELCRDPKRDSCAMAQIDATRRAPGAMRLRRSTQALLEHCLRPTAFDITLFTSGVPRLTRSAASGGLGFFVSTGAFSCPKAFPAVLKMPAFSASNSKYRKTSRVYDRSTRPRTSLAGS